MTRTKLAFGVLVVTAFAAAPLQAQHDTSNPFRPIYGWGELPEGREWGSTSAVAIAPDGNIWVAERCARNVCVDSEGELLMTIGTPGEAGLPPTHLTQPSDVLVARNGHIYVADAHDRARGRIVRYDADGNYMETWGDLGFGPGQFRDLHALAMDSQGRIFVGDRYNNRIQIFEGRVHRDLGAVRQAERPLHRRRRQHLRGRFRVEPRAHRECTGQHNAGWEKGIRIGDARMGWGAPPLASRPRQREGFSGPEGVAVDDEGNVYGAEVAAAHNEVGAVQAVSIGRP